MNYLAAATAILCLQYSAFGASAGEVKCREDSHSTNAVNFILSSKRNGTRGDWVTDFSLSKDDSDANELNNVTLHLSQDVKEVKGKRTVHIRGVIRGISPYRLDEQNEGGLKDKLLFHTTSGVNVAVVNDGRTIKKINVNVDGGAVAFTHRPLEVNERLEVSLEKKTAKFDHSFAIGVTTNSPTQFQHINSIKNTSWAMYHGNTYHNGGVSMTNYGQNLDALSVGDRLGVMRSNTGSLHFFVNGVDQGPAASNVPHPVYGLVELWGNAAMASIVDS